MTITSILTQPCRVEGCPEILERATRRQFCDLHRTCLIEGCGYVAHTSRNLCTSHWGALKDSPDFDILYPKRVLRQRPDRYLNDDGYIYVRQPNGQSIGEHRIVMQRILGRKLLPGESVHHKNGVRDDNRPGNLELWVVPQRNGQRAIDMRCPHCKELWYSEPTREASQ